MKGDRLPNSDHAARYVSGSRHQGGKVVGEAFAPKGDEERPSVHWMETFGGDLAHQKTEVRRVNTMVKRPSAVFARLNVGAAKSAAAIEEFHFPLDFLHDPLTLADDGQDDPSHAGISGLPDADSPEAEAAGDLLAQAVVEIFPVVA